MLERFNELRTRDIEAVRTTMRMRGREGRFDLPNSRTRSDYVINAVRSPDLSLSCIRHNAPISMGFQPSDESIVGFQLRKTSQFVLDGTVHANDAARPGCIAPAGRPWSVRNPDGFDVLLLLVPAAVASRKQSAYLGTPTDRVDLLQPADADPVGAARLRQLVVARTREIDEAETGDAARLLGDATDEIYLALLESLSLQVPERKEAAPSPVEVGRVEQYLVAHYDRPVTIEQLAGISGVSARSVVQYFQARYGHGPNAYRERIQTAMAHARLPVCADRASMALIARQCGFATLQRFEVAYRQHFGHPPEPGLKKSRSRK